MKLRYYAIYMWSKQRGLAYPEQYNCKQLFPMKPRCKFTQNTPNNPKKCGIKFWLVSDTNTTVIRNKAIHNSFE